ncbi:MAG: hypothetical protein ACR2QL_04295 [Woeseiaceae bacterium]
MMTSLQLLNRQRNIGAAMGGGITKILIATIFLAPALCLAQDDGEAVATQKWGISIGAFITDQDMKTEFGVNFGDASLRVDFEDDLGLEDSQSVGRLAAFYKFNGRHQLDFDIFDLSQSSTAVLDKEFKWGDTTFPIDAEVATGLDLGIYKIAYTYFPVTEEKGKFGLTGGFYVADIGLSLRILPDDMQEVGAVTAPLPVLGFRGEYYFSERWRGSASIEWFGLEIDEYDGHLQDSLLGIDYRMTEHFALGLGYNHVEIDVDATDKALRADLIWQYSGLILYLRSTF